MSVHLDIKPLNPHLKVNWNVLMCKICIARRLVVNTFHDTMQILCLSLAGRWWRTEWETGQLDNNNCAPSFLRSLCKIGGDCFGLRYFSEGAEKYQGPKQSLTNSHNDQKIDGAKLLLSLIIALIDILMYFRCNLWRNTLFNLFLHSLSIHPWERILICPGMTIIVYINKRSCAQCSMCACFAF